MQGKKTLMRVVLPVLVLASIAVIIYLFSDRDIEPRVEPIAVNEITFFTLREVPEGEPAECTPRQIKQFASAYNRARYYPDEYGATHPLRVDIVFADGTSLTVWGGAEDFQTMERDGEQRNIKSAGLGAWFGSVD